MLVVLIDILSLSSASLLQVTALLTFPRVAITMNSIDTRDVRADACAQQDDGVDPHAVLPSVGETATPGAADILIGRCTEGICTSIGGHKGPPQPRHKAMGTARTTL